MFSAKERQTPYIISAERQFKLKYDVVIVGAGPAGIFTAIEMVRNNTDKKILIVEKGASVEKRSCPKSKTKTCMNCKPYCHITTGFSGAGAFSDGKLSLSCEVGGTLPELIGEELAQETINYTDKIYLEFGADTHVEGVSDPDKIRDIRKKAINANLKLVDCPIRHMGTEKAQGIYRAISAFLAKVASASQLGVEQRRQLIVAYALRKYGIVRRLFPPLIGRPATLPLR